MAEREVSFRVNVEGVSREARELAQLEVSLKKMRKEKLDLIKASIKEGQVSEANAKKIANLNNKISDNSKAQKELKKNLGITQSSFLRLGKTLLASAGIFTGATVGLQKLFGVIKAGTDDVREFESTFTDVLTLLDEAQKEQFADILQVGAVGLMADYGFEIGETNKALFDYISATGDVAGSMEFLSTASRTAVAGASSLSAA